MTNATNNTPGRLLGVADIAEAIGHGTTRQKVALWKHRKKLPPPAAVVSRGRGHGIPLWREEDVRKFIAEARAAAKKGAAKRRSC